MTGQIGFDEGGVLQSLATPIIHQERTVVKTSKKGKVTTTKSVFELTGAQVVAAIMGSALVALFLHGRPGLDSTITPPAVQEGLAPGGLPSLPLYKNYYGAFLGAILYARALKKWKADNA